MEIMSFSKMDKRLQISKMLNDLCILILFALMLSAQKGSNAFGFDSATSCSPNGKQSRRGRAQMLATIPCDLTRQAYCNLPGAAYPWHAVRRFVHENQGLMRRMYGDVRHISVLRDEIRNNEIDIEDIEMAAERYSRNGDGRRSSRYMRQRDEDFAADGDVGGGGFKDDVFLNSMATTRKTPQKTVNGDRTNEGGAMRNKYDIVKEENIEKYDEINEKTNKNENTNTNTNDDGNLSSNSVYELPTLIANGFVSPSFNGDNIEIIESPQLDIELQNVTKPAATTSTSSNASPTIAKISTTSPEKTSSPPTTSKIATTTRPPSTSSTRIFSTKKPTTISHIDSYRRHPQYADRYRPSQLQQRLQLQQQRIYKINTTLLPTKESFVGMNSKQRPNESERIFGTTTKTPLSTTSPTPLTPITEKTQQFESTNSNASPIMSAALKAHTTNVNKPNRNHSPANDKPTTTSPTQTSTTPAPISPSSTTVPFTKAKIELLSGEKLRRQPTVVGEKPMMPTTAPSMPPTKPPLLRDGQLYQDTVKQEPTPIANLRGINACPVKEEVVAPFWANNTRGEVLALLNLYPFEQYVHWEKCTHEHKQMYCRDGCRCEQQYRLHRLLAYDPHNECRGIFSDWFRFPSCCICKCYNIPMEFRATSRSPRMQSFPNHEDITADTADRRHPLEIAEEEVKRAIYEHATEEWYRPREDYDDAEDY